MKEFRTDRGSSGQRLDKFCRRELSFAPSSFIYKMLRKKNIRLNGKRASGKEVLQEGDTVTFYLSDETFGKFHRGPEAKAPDLAQYERAYGTIKLQILYEDSDVLFACKDAGILSQKSKPDDLSANEWIVGYVIQKWKKEGLSERDCELSLRTFRPSVCNRLDRNTGGILIFAVSLKGSQVMAELLRERTIRKFYRMVVRGHVSEAGTAGGWLCKDTKTNMVTLYKERESAPAGAKPVRTDYRPLSWGRDVTLVEAELITGKPHQLRAHMASLGHPILGDDKYGDRSLNRRVNLHGQLLFCCRVELPQDTGALAQLSGKVITARMPDIFEKVLRGA